jgi:hypothetical protein
MKKMAAGWVYQHSWHSFIGTGRQKTLMGFNGLGIKCMTRIVGQLWSHWQHPLVHLQKGDVTRKPWRFRRKCNLWVVTPTSSPTLSLVISTQGLGNWIAVRNWLSTLMWCRQSLLEVIKKGRSWKSRKLNLMACLQMTACQSQASLQKC